MWGGAKIIKTSLTDSLDLTNYLSGLTIPNPQVLIVPTGCYGYVEDLAREIEGLTIIEDQNMQFSITSWEDDLWQLAKDTYAQLNEIAQMNSFTSLRKEEQEHIKKMLQVCAALQHEREKDGPWWRYNVTYTCLSQYNKNLCLMLQLLHKAQELSGWEEYLYIDENLHSMFNKAYQDALSSINEHPLLITKQEIKKMQMLYDAALEVCNGIRNSYGDLKILLQLTDTLKKNEWYVNVPDIQKVALDQAIEVAQTIVDKGEYDANLQQVKTTLEDAYHVALKSSIQQLVSQVKSYTETDIANIYSYLDGKKVVDEVIARVMAELDTDNYSSMLQIADSLQALFSNVKIEAEKYGAELQNAKQNANQLLTDVYTLQNETYKDIYPRYS